MVWFGVKKIPSLVWFRGKRGARVPGHQGPAEAAELMEIKGRRKGETS